MRFSIRVAISVHIRIRQACYAAYYRYYAVLRVVYTIVYVPSKSLHISPPKNLQIPKTTHLFTALQTREAPTMSLHAYN